MQRIQRLLTVGVSGFAAGAFISGTIALVAVWSGLYARPGFLNAAPYAVHALIGPSALFAGLVSAGFCVRIGESASSAAICSVGVSGAYALVLVCLTFRLASLVPAMLAADAALAALPPVFAVMWQQSSRQA